MEQNTINQRVKILVDTFDKGNKSSFARRVGISNQSLGEIIGQKQNSPSFSALQKLVQAFPEIREVWLILGEGPMMKCERTETAANKISVSDDAQCIPTVPPGAGEVGISPELLRGDTQGPVDQPGFSYGIAVKPKPAGLDLVERVEQNSDDIKQLQAALSKIQKQLKS